MVYSELEMSAWVNKQLIFMLIFVIKWFFDHFIILVFVQAHKSLHPQNNESNASHI